MSAFFFVGAPGSGKTSIVREILDIRWACYSASPKWTICGKYAAAGHYYGATFDGADTIPYNGAAAAIEYWDREIRGGVMATFFDGDRFSDAACLARIGALGKCFCVLVECNEAELEARRARRGAIQNRSWMQGRATKARRFAEKFSGDALLRLDACGSITDNASKVQGFIEAKLR